MGTKLSQLTADAAPTFDDLLYGVQDPGGTPASRKWTLDALRTTLRGYAAKTANYPAVSADRTLDVDATSGVVTITLPAVATTPIGFMLTIRKVDNANSVVIDGNSSETINGDLTQVLFTQFAFLTIANTGSAWVIVNSHGVLSGRLFNSTASATIANSASEATIIGSGIGNLTLPANFWRVGRVLRARASGVISDTGTPTARFRGKLGSTVITDSTAVALAGTLSNTGWHVDITLTCRTVGASGTIFGYVVFEYGPTNRIVAGTTAAITVDTTVAAALDLQFTWGTADALNTITGSQFTASWD